MAQTDLLANLPQGYFIVNLVILVFTLLGAILAIVMSRKEGEKNTPWALLFSFLYPGLGHIYARKYLGGLFLTVIFALLCGYCTPVIACIVSFHLPSLAELFSWDTIFNILDILTPSWLRESSTNHSPTTHFLVILFIWILGLSSVRAVDNYNTHLQYLAEMGDDKDKLLDN